MFEIKQINQAQLKVSGELTRHTLNKKNYLTSMAYFTQGDLEVDLSELVKVDTAGLAWLLAVVEKYLPLPGKLHFVHLSDELIKLAKLSGVDSFLPTRQA